MQQYKASAELLQLRKQQEHSAKQRDYAAAHQTQQAADKLENKEKKQFMEQVTKKLMGAEANLMNKQ